MDNVSIILLNWNGWRNTIECLESVFRSDYQSYRVIVCDNASEDNSIELIKAWAEGRLDVPPSPGDLLGHLSFPPVPKPIPYSYYQFDGLQLQHGGDQDGTRRLVIIRNDKNRGFGGGNNPGIAFALADHDSRYVWLLNNDTRIDSKALTYLVRRAGASSEIGAVGSVLYYMHSPEQVQSWSGGKIDFWCGTARNFTTPVDDARLHFIYGASLFLRAEALEQVGVFDESFFMYWEEADLCLRLRKAGWKLATAELSRVWHQESGSIGKKSASLYAYFNDSAVIFFSRYASVPFFPIAIGLAGRFIKRLIRCEWEQARAVLFSGRVKNQSRSSRKKTGQPINTRT